MGMAFVFKFQCQVQVVWGYLAQTELTTVASGSMGWSDSGSDNFFSSEAFLNTSQVDLYSTWLRVTF